MMKKFMWAFTGVVVTIMLILAVTSVNSYWSEIDEAKEDYEREFEIASATSRMLLSTRVDRLRQIRDELDDLNTPIWLSNNTKEDLVEAFDLGIDGFLAFMIDENDQGAVQAIAKFTEMNAMFAEYEAKRGRE